MHQRFADEVEEAGGVFEAVRGRGAAAEDTDALPRGLDEPVVGPGAAAHRLVPEVVVDGVALAAASVAGPAEKQGPGPSGAVEVTVKLPAGSRVEAKTAGAELRTVGRLGDIAFDGAYHQVKLDEAASLRLTAVDGDVEVGRLGGAAEISTARGDIRIAEALGGTVVLGTRSGDITVAAASGVSAALDAATTYGRVSNTLKNNGTAELDIRATTSHGDITTRSL
ncbi:DUF4097 family beta strand repeat protein [Streptomyces sp. SID5473]|uniref:DUF4097 domain-containing protein n=1 Tax=Streptomyces tsukubensis (strain DSM 42081 / NBRC 108919 / NRRL 18488 / 9993) TaxID=1114943 RepID=A0A7G3URC8_STRT9|nr:DUF4097 family beta strand repeat protein [Streptomyces sp. SID5473]QKM71705.1 hypothetical protein STSU_018950 [Streptomyces tsukubensis NRRL18488]TAI43854.1 hypothetical protein EWI31_18705 [Streptomyces tsukubensis]